MLMTAVGCGEGQRRAEGWQVGSCASKRLMKVIGRQNIRSRGWTKREEREVEGDVCWSKWGGLLGDVCAKTMQGHA